MSLAALAAGSVLAVAALGALVVAPAAHTAASEPVASSVQTTAPAGPAEAVASSGTTIMAQATATPPVTATPQAAATVRTFSDIGGDEWFADAVYALAADGIVYGREDGSFGPDDPVTRGQMVAFLARVLHLPDSPAEPFVDVLPGDWCAGAVGALYERGLISGTDPVTFSPSLPVSRQQAAALVMRSLSFALEAEPEPAVDYELADYQTSIWLAGFRDRALIAPEQAGFVANAYRLGVIEGAEDGWLYPALTLTRAQMAGMLYRAFYQPVVARNAYPVELPAVSAYATQSVGSEGPLVSFLESQLTALHYPCGLVDGVYDRCTKDAVMAFEKVEKLPRNGIAEAEVWQRIFAAQTPTPHLYLPGDRVEVDLTRQVLFMIKDGVVAEVVHVSTGKLGTPTGHGSVGLKQTGWVECSVGWMYYPSYFRPTIAIHGSSSVPPYPASHGCVRLPVWITESIYAQLLPGMGVDVYY